jgi:hypothetical protein
MIIQDLYEASQLCPECGGISFSDLILAEKKDACYYKVKASAKVWPSAYASGRLVQCRKKGADNYGNKNESTDDNFGKPAAMMKASPEALKIAQSIMQQQADKNVIGQAKIAGAVPSQGMAEGPNDTIYPNAEVIKSKNGKPVGEIYQDGNSWGAFHYRADRGYDLIDSREDAIEALRDLHQETGRSRPDYTIKGVAEGSNEVDEGWKDKLAAVGLAGAMAMGASGANARVSYDADGNKVGGFKPVATQQAGGSSQELNLVDNISKDTDGSYTITHNNKEYQVKIVPKNMEAVPRSATKVKVTQAQMGIRGIGTYVAYLLPNGTAFLLSGQPTNENDVAEDNDEKIAGRHDPKDFDAMVGRLKQLAGAGPLKTVWDEKKRVYRNVPTAQQPNKSQ